MLLLRLLILGAALWLAYFMAKRWWRARPAAQRRRSITQDTVRCVECGEFLPKQLAERVDGNHYRCPEHRQQADR